MNLSTSENLKKAHAVMSNNATHIDNLAKVVAASISRSPQKRKLVEYLAHVGNTDIFLGKLCDKLHTQAVYHIFNILAENGAGKIASVPRSTPGRGNKYLSQFIWANRERDQIALKKALELGTTSCPYAKLQRQMDVRSEEFSQVLFYMSVTPKNKVTVSDIVKAFPEVSTCRYYSKAVLSVLRDLGLGDADRLGRFEWANKEEVQQKLSALSYSKVKPDIVTKLRERYKPESPKSALDGLGMPFTLEFDEPQPSDRPSIPKLAEVFSREPQPSDTDKTTKAGLVIIPSFNVNVQVNLDGKQCKLICRDPLTKEEFASFMSILEKRLGKKP